MKIKQLLCQSKPESQYLKDAANNKIFTHEGEEKIYRNIWKSIFTQEDNNNENEIRNTISNI